MKYSRLQKYWLQAAKDLKIEISCPYVFTTKNFQIEIEVLVKEYGAKCGMLIVKDYDLIEAHLIEIEKKGFGFSVMSEPNDLFPYTREDALEVLKDWGTN